MKNYNGLIELIDEASKELQEVDCTKSPTDEELTMLEGLISSANGLKSVVNYILTGD